jgi:protein-S-isoprenylcysteine O-methyltransferase Ste14
VWMYVRLAKTEERDSEQLFGQAWREYAARTPRFFPRLGAASGPHVGDMPLTG